MEIHPRNDLNDRGTQTGIPEEPQNPLNRGFAIFCQLVQDRAGSPINVALKLSDHPVNPGLIMVLGEVMGRECYLPQVSAPVPSQHPGRRHFDWHCVQGFDQV
jgi:hypothetical protein